MSNNTSNNSSNDTSNVFLHDLLSLNANDLSDTRISFINYLLNAMNNTNINENLAMLPLAGIYNNAQRSNIANLNELLNRTLQEKYIYKKVLSDQGKQQLKEIIYDSKKFDTKECAITQDTFVEGQTIIQLPCSHIFDPESIKTWLKEESSKCPICRYELKSKEIKTDIKLEEDNNTNITNTHRTNTHRTNTHRTTRLPRINEEEEDEYNDNDNNYNTMFSNMNILYNNYNNRPQVRAQGRRRRRLISQEQFLNRIIDMQNSYTEDRLVQNAIIARLQDLQNTTGNSTQNTAENTAENAEENTISEINFDAMHDDYFDELEDLYD